MTAEDANKVAAIDEALLRWLMSTTGTKWSHRESYRMDALEEEDLKTFQALLHCSSFLERDVDAAMQDIVMKPPYQEPEFIAYQENLTAIMKWSFLARGLSRNADNRWFKLNIAEGIRVRSMDVCEQADQLKSAIWAGGSICDQYQEVCLETAKDVWSYARVVVARYKHNQFTGVHQNRRDTNAQNHDILSLATGMTSTAAATTTNTTTSALKGTPVPPVSHHSGNVIAKSNLIPSRMMYNNVESEGDDQVTEEQGGWEDVAQLYLMVKEMSKNIDELKTTQKSARTQPTETIQTSQWSGRQPVWLVGNHTPALFTPEGASAPVLTEFELDTAPCQHCVRVGRSQLAASHHSARYCSIRCPTIRPLLRAYLESTGKVQSRGGRREGGATWTRPPNHVPAPAPAPVKDEAKIPVIPISNPSNATATVVPTVVVAPAAPAGGPASQ
jgi:hypothetical protein